MNYEVAFAIYPESLGSFLRLSLCNFEDFRGEEILNMSKFNKRKERRGGRSGVVEPIKSYSRLTTSVKPPVNFDPVIPI